VKVVAFEGYSEWYFFPKNFGAVLTPPAEAALLCVVQ